MLRTATTTHGRMHACSQTPGTITPDVDKVEHNTEGLSDSHVALQRALPRVHAPVVCSSVSQTRHIDQKKRRRFPSTFVYSVVVEMLETKRGGEVGVRWKDAFLRRRGYPATLDLPPFDSMLRY